MHYPAPKQPYKKALFTATAYQATYHAPPDSTAAYHPHSSSAYAQANHGHVRKVGHPKARAHHPRVQHPHLHKPVHPKHHVLHHVHSHLPPGVEEQPF